MSKIRKTDAWLRANCSDEAYYHVVCLKADIVTLTTRLEMAEKQVRELDADRKRLHRIIAELRSR